MTMHPLRVPEGDPYDLGPFRRVDPFWVRLKQAQLSRCACPGRGLCLHPCPACWPGDGSLLDPCPRINQGVQPR